MCCNSLWILKPGIDTKGDDTIVTRIGLTRKVDHLIDINEKLSNYLDTIPYELICNISKRVERKYIK